MRVLLLDHVYVRGLDVLGARLRTDITSSDHHPIELVVEVFDS